MRNRFVTPGTLTALLWLAACSQEPVAPPAPEVTAPSAAEQQQAIDAFFTRFTDQWVEANPNLAISSGYFTGDKQNSFEQQITPLTREHRLQLDSLAREGLAELATLPLDAATDTQRLAADLMQWQLQLVIDEEPLLDWTAFPLEQMDGASVLLPNQLTVVQPLLNADHAVNYVERLKLVDDRMREATSESSRRAELGIILPANILQTTIEQM